MSRKAASSVGSFLLSLLLYGIPLSLAAYSYVRIVRLSFVEGDVRVVRPNSAGPVRGLANLPLEHNSAVETANGVAEIEFEEDAFARLAPGSRLHLAELGLLGNGERVTRLFLAQGTATFDADLPSGDSFLVLTPQFQVTVAKEAVFRVDFSPDGSRVRVFQGDVRVEAQASTLRVAAGQMLEWRAASAESAEAESAEGEMRLTRNPEPDAWDQWNQERRQVARALLNYQAPLSGGFFATPWYSHSYYPYYSSCSGWSYDPFAGWWTWGPGGLTDPFYGVGSSYWYTGAFPGCAWYWPRWGPVYGGGTTIPPAPPPPSPTPPPPSGGGAGEQPRRTGDPRERVPRHHGPLWMDVFDLQQPDSEARHRLPVINTPPGEPTAPAEVTRPAGPVATPVNPRLPQPRAPRAEPLRPEAARPPARPNSISPSPRINSRTSSAPVSRPTAGGAGQVRSSPSRSTPRTSPPPSNPRP